MPASAIQMNSHAQSSASHSRVQYDEPALPLVVLFDTSVCTRNLGDQIIMDSVRRQLRQTLPNAFLCNVATHDYLSEESYKLLDAADLAIVGGTNLLSADLRKYNQWKIGFRDAFKLNNIVLLGVGWWQYQHKPTRYTGWLLRQVLDRTLIHSVRDEYTRKQLASANIYNVFNTGCVTLWELSDAHLSAIPAERADTVVMTLTDYKPDIKRDKILFNILAKYYRKIFLWLQGSRDFSYAKSVVDSKVEFISPCLEAYDELLGSNIELDYVGTRLHAGIRALQHGRRTAIVAVDNRAKEMGSDFALPVVERAKIDELRTMLEAPFAIDLRLPRDEIEVWKEQLRTATRKS